MKNKEHHFGLIQTPRLLIREFELSDSKAYYDLFSNQQVILYLPVEPFKALNEAVDALVKIRQEYQNNLFYRLAVEEHSTKTCIGYIGLSRKVQPPKTCEVVYAYREAFWYKGYAKEALMAYCTYLEKTFDTIIGGHVEKNKASGVVLEKCGFIRKPSLDTTMMIHQENVNIYNYARERKENK